MTNPKWTGELAAVRLDMDGTEAGASVAVHRSKGDILEYH